MVFLMFTEFQTMHSKHDKDSGHLEGTHYVLRLLENVFIPQQHPRRMKIKQ